MRYYVTNLGERAAQPDLSIGFGLRHYASILLIDPVGGKAYLPSQDERSRQVGSDTRRGLYQPGVRYEHVLAFAELPADLAAVTVLTNTTAGEFTGIPVKDASGTPGPSAPPAPVTGAAAGETYSWPLSTDVGDAEGRIVDLYGYTETDSRSTDGGGKDERIGLRTDVLFAHDSDKLSPASKDVLDQAAADIRARAGLELRITGHTDDSGTDSYNLALSQRRVKAVERELRARLGSGYKYLAKGVGEAEPAVKPSGPRDDAARARNRRVEIAYELRPQEPVPGVNAAFRAVDGPVVASGEAEIVARMKKTKRRIDVKGFYRDGAYLVAVFDIANLDAEPLPEVMSAFTGPYGGTFGAFSVEDPATGVHYGGVRLGPERTFGRTFYADPGESVFTPDPDTANRGFFYTLAPPPSVTSVTFHAGPFGTFKNIPVQ
ncbi:OmpA family protein [Actinocorallia sp. API 0066]|uniref:OmpA family protein n=1 Tax=Actinocorallia sp. API 0066 TaxID=2896846 RepID=UPI001E585901|nr:OmpA family protein [Actinocorallia sp. API 0066]MCD0448721.1 OmpA family protein [Actinocorallia sp. API 0066]